MRSLEEKIERATIRLRNTQRLMRRSERMLDKYIDQEDDLIGIIGIYKIKIEKRDSQGQ